jgi:hypothetical protein
MHKAEIVGNEELPVCSSTKAKFQVFKFIPARFDIAQRTVHFTDMRAPTMTAGRHWRSFCAWMSHPA